ncbi:MAG: glycosyltransferase family 39 protein, partial [Planctomycetes bacterium]|nr:glycosyltransferase family 39 protein [Planctomycetota bacterium]
IDFKAMATQYRTNWVGMLSSPSNFFFGAFEPGGSVTVDKPPLGFWVQAVSAAMIGVNGFALALPQALAGVLSVGLLFNLVRRSFGMGAGLLAALTLEITPVAVSTERNNTIDGLLVFVLLLATWAFVKAAERGRWRYVLLGAFLVGLGFNIKMLQAYLPLPALYAFYLLAGKTALWRKVLQLAVATILLLAVSLSWAVVVDLIPPESRPYIGSSSNNTVMELIVGHNGLARLLPGGERLFGFFGAFQ